MVIGEKWSSKPICPHLYTGETEIVVGCQTSPPLVTTLMNRQGLFVHSHTAEAFLGHFHACQMMLIISAASMSAWNV
jgi:hypothetical protein